MDPHAEPTPNAFASPTSEDYVEERVADNPPGLQRKAALGLVLWIAWLLVVLTFIVWLVG
ncbi:hypothetical protein NG895_07550 [Aeoliella sp. ICT_H6.2]|uniref:Uncharacterized protein n=1 Tax=Aeoliella straminimaris TaxID=2954799 RepID=A0A9X2FCG0_9BACT|nr:hypothetical protein [Aeoliella straminimaris]MCO6043759.1 hypothetical protein [Aeoliella straminimaris]